jgi:hypothetical protein
VKKAFVPTYSSATGKEINFPLIDANNNYREDILFLLYQELHIAYF